MDGVTILNEFEVVTKTIFSWESFWIGATPQEAITACDEAVKVLTEKYYVEEPEDD